MSKYGHFFNGPGLPNFSGYPSKNHGMPSGHGRYNAPCASAPGVPVPSVPMNAAKLPTVNVYTGKGWLVEAGQIELTGSHYAKSAYYHRDQLNTLTVDMLDGEIRSYSGLPFAIIYELKWGTAPGEAFDRYINPVFPCVVDRPRTGNC